MVNAVALRILIMLAVTAEGFVLHSRNNVSLSRHNVSDGYLEKPSMKRYDHYHYEQKLNANSYEICETTECKTVADEFLSSMNKSIDPCYDFYEFACGKWTTESPIPASSPNWSRFTVFESAVKYRLKGIFETSPMASDILPLSQAKKWYRSCMDAERLEQRGIQPINSILMQIGGWPLAMDAEEWDEEVTWQRIDRHYARLKGSYTFFELESGLRLNETEFGKISILPSELPLFKKLPRLYRDHISGNYQAYIRLIEEVVHLFVEHNRAVVSKQRVRKEIENLVEFEKQIDNLKRTTGHSNCLTFSAFITDYNSNMTDMSGDSKTNIDWKSLIEDLFATVNIVVSPSAIIHLSNTAYIQGIPPLLKRTPLRTIVNYIHWKFVGNTLAYTTEKMRNKLLLPMLEEMFGVKERPPRWSECIDDMKMTHAAAYAFVEKYFSESTKNAGLKMAYEIRTELEANINESNWLDVDSKVVITEKLNSMNILVGYPDWYSKLAIIDHYKGLIIGSEYFDNILNYIKYERKRELKRHVITKINVPPWYIDPITVNAMYGRKENTVNMPAAVFQSPLFTEGLPDSVNWGVVGVLIGHEMSHAFDDCAILYGDKGTRTGLSEDTLKSYYERAECFVTQFNVYDGKNIPLIKRPWNCKDPKGSEGEKTVSENIADTTGLRAVYQAYKKAFDKKSHAEKRLPGLEEFTDDQLFFISFAELWCEVDTPRFTEITKGAVNDAHSPGPIRVLGTLSNTKDFAKAFDCPINSFVNSRETCDIWSTPDAKPKAPTEAESNRS